MLAASVAVAVGWSNQASGLRGDVDGDDRPDSVSLVRHARSFVLRVDTGRVVITKTVRGFSGPQADGIGDPKIVALRRMNTTPGFEIEVEVWHGAANQFLIFYTLHRGRLIAMPGGPHDPADVAFVWDVGGTAGTGASQADCVRRSLVGVLLEWSHRGIWHYQTTTYDVRATRFVKRGVYEIASERMLPAVPRDWPQVRRLAFESCR